ncbi:MAG: S-layer homology domain-containing protein [Clostridiaceae bacterium]|nr:S-layer homology domain-containing protein [Clostridiaceae bacterium]
MIQRKKAFAFILVLTLLVSMHLGQTFAAASTHEEIEAIIEEVAKEKEIPSVILKAIAWKESNYRQFDSNGNPLVSGGNTGIMQINRVHRHLDQERLRHDIRYNIEAGADILLGRWNATSIYPTVGDRDPNVLEHWYFALWGYNGWVARNNPNVSGNRAYQEELFQLIRDRYNQPVTSIDASYLPNSGLPKGSLHIPTPELHHFGDLNDDHKAIFVDLIDHPKREYVEELYAMEIINGVGGDEFNPDGYITKEQVAKILVEVLELEIIDDEVVVADWQEVSSWAVDYVATAYHQGILSPDEEGNLHPDEFIKREDAIEMLFQGYGVPILLEENELLRPQEYITRGELSKLIYNIIEGL